MRRLLNPRADADMHQRLGGCDTDFVTLEKALCLRPGENLNDEVINFRMVKLRRDALAAADHARQHMLPPGRLDRDGARGVQPTYVCTSLFLSKLLGREGVYTYAEVRRWTRRVTLDWNTVRWIVIPRNIGNQHWALIVADLTQRCLHVYDSYSGATFREPDGRPVIPAEQVYAGVRQWISDDSADKLGDAGRIDTQNWRVHEYDLPRQQDGFNCGVFMCSYAACIVTGRRFTNLISAATINILRSRMLLEVVSTAPTAAPQLAGGEASPSVVSRDDDMVGVETVVPAPPEHAPVATTADVEMVDAPAAATVVTSSDVEMVDAVGGDAALPPLAEGASTSANSGTPPTAAAAPIIMLDACAVIPRHAMGGGSDAAAVGALRAANDLFNGRAEGHVRVEHEDEDPLNEFAANDALLAGAFPTLFPLGYTPSTGGSVSDSKAEHLLLQFHNTFAQSTELVFVLMNQKQRHAAARSASATVMNHPEAAQRFADAVSDNEFLADLKEASTPLPATASESERRERAALERRVLSRVTSFILIAGRSVPFSPLQRNNSLSQLYALVYTFGEPSIFFTVALDDAYSSQGIRLSLSVYRRHGDDLFPVAEDGLMDALRSGMSTTHGIDISPGGLAARLAANPVAAALVFKHVLQVLVEQVFGSCMSDSIRKTLPVMSRIVGALGVVIAHYIVLEVQGRGSLHAHGCLFTHLSPALLQACAGHPTLEPVACRAVDRLVSATLPVEVHTAHLLPPAARGSTMRASLRPVPDPEAGVQALREAAHAVMASCGVHSHTFTCRKGDVGKERCRLMMPRALAPSTLFRQLKVTVEEREERAEASRGQRGGDGGVDSGTRDASAGRKKQKPKKKKKIYHVEALPAVQPAPAVPAPSRSDPVPRGDVRLVVLELLRPAIEVQAYLTTPEGQDMLASLPTHVADELRERVRTEAKLASRNGYVVETNPVMAATLRCNTNAMPLGSASQARPTLFYLVKYICKDGAPLSQSLTIIYNALIHVRDIPSVAEDAGTVSRTATYAITRIVNSLGGAAELSGAAAAYSILGGTSALCSHNFNFVWPLAAVEFCLRANRIRRDRSVAAGAGGTAGMLSDSAWSAVESDMEDEHEWGSDWNDDTFVRRMRWDDDEADDDAAAEEEDLACALLDADTAPAHDGGDGSDGEEDVWDLHDELGADVNVDEELQGGDVEEYTGADPRAAQRARGGSRVFETDDGPVMVSNDDIYAHRPLQLQHMSYATFFRCVSLVKRKGEADHDGAGDGRGRKRNGRYKFQEPPRGAVLAHQFPLADTHELALRSKYTVLIYCGPRPPLWPGPRPERDTATWRRRALAFARYMLVLFKPWDIHQHSPGRLSWGAFVRFVCALHESRTLVNSHTLAQIHNLAHAMRVPAADAYAQTLWRGRAADRWADLPPAAGGSAGGGGSDGPGSQGGFSDTQAESVATDEYMRAAQAAVDDLRERAGLTEQLGIAALTGQQRELEAEFDRLYGSVATTCTASVQTCVSPVSTYTRTTAATVYGAARTADMDAVEDACDGVNDDMHSVGHDDMDAGGVLPPGERQLEGQTAPGELRADTTANDFMELNDGQRRVAMSVLDHVMAQDRVPAASRVMLRLLVHGGPGTGKTFLMNRLDTVLRSKRLGSICAAAFTGNAAALLPRGYTLHSLLGLSIKKSKSGLSATSRTKLLNRVRDSRVLLIDEISMVDAQLFASVLSRLDETQNDTQICCIVLQGDMFQLPPTSGTALYVAALRSRGAAAAVVASRARAAAAKCTDRDTAELSAGNAFAEYQLCALTQQQRAPDDVEHCRMITRLRSHDGHVSAADLGRIGALTAAEAASPEWTFATHICTSNSRRTCVNWKQAARFASAHAAPLVTWSLPMTFQASGKAGATVTLTDAELRAVMRTDVHNLVGTFVTGAPAVLSENINTALGLVNGADVTLHSLILAADTLAVLDSGTTLLPAEVQMRTAAPGVRVHLNKPPEYIVVSIKSGGREWPSEAVLGTHDSDGQSERCYLLPIPNTTQDTVSISVAPRPGLSKAVKVKRHPVELAFAVTYHKSQGRTCHRVILHMEPGAQPALRFSAMYVGLTRVRNGAHMRIFPQPHAGSVEHVTRLRADSDIHDWLRGFDAEGKWVAPRGAATGAAAATPAPRGATSRRGRGGAPAGARARSSRPANAATGTGAPPMESPPPPPVPPIVSPTPAPVTFSSLYMPLIHAASGKVLSAAQQSRIARVQTVMSNAGQAHVWTTLVNAYADDFRVRAKDTERVRAVMRDVPDYADARLQEMLLHPPHADGAPGESRVTAATWHALQVAATAFREASRV